jgi:hypothetical protein
MHISPLQGVIDHLRRLTDPNRSRELCDADLLERFRTQREESAFTLLVQRHGPLSLGGSNLTDKGKRRDFSRFFRGDLRTGRTADTIFLR